MNGEHVPVRPHWSCRNPDCGMPWPCDPAKDRLRQELVEHPEVTRAYLAQQFHACVIDYTGVPVADLYDRIVGWAFPR